MSSSISRKYPVCPTWLPANSGINLVVAGGTTLLVIVLAQHQHASSFTIGLIFACGGIGSILGSLLAPFLQKQLSFGQAIIYSSWLLALLWPLYAVVPNVVALGILTTILFLLAPIYNVVNASYRLALVPDEFQGRANSAVRLISFASPSDWQRLVFSFKISVPVGQSWWEVESSCWPPERQR